MIDLTKIERYHENNRIEAKKALGGLPKSMWETYSAFANTLGGIILLGVEEHADHSLHLLDLPDPQRLVKEFWDIVNNPKKVSVNVLSDKHVQIKTVNDKHIIVIHVPRAQRFDKPVYIDDNPLSGTYRRNGEGDYKCTREEVQAMLRDAAVQTQDMKVLAHMGMDVLDGESVRRYRLRMQNYRPGHVWEELDDEAFLYKLGAAGGSSDGSIHPTAAGLLMFGYEYEIVKEFPHYFLDYREQLDADTRWTDRVVSSSGDWSGNLYDFYFRVYQKIVQDIKIPFKLEDGSRIDDTPVHNALREALANCLINADYYGRQGLVVVKRTDAITISNPGAFRIELETAKSGGISDPRNVALMKMFNLINIGERAGSGIPNIYTVWEKLEMSQPDITEQFEPDRTILTLPLQKEKHNAENKKIGDKKSAIKIGDKKSAINQNKKNQIVDYLTDHPYAKTADIAQHIDLKPSRTRDYLCELVTEEIIVAEGSNKNRIYTLKS